MKKLVSILFVALVFFSLTQMAIADTITTLSTMGTYAGSAGGGEFTVLPGGSTLPGFVNSYDSKTRDIMQTGTFQTFCLEVNEFISPNTTYNAVLNTAAVGGGAGGGSPDPISKGTAYLYYQFAKGLLSGYNYSGTEKQREDSADDLQRMIWWLEDEGVSGILSNPFYLLLAGMGWDETAMKDNNNGTYGVMALNLTLNGENKQDLLIITPEPFTLLLLGLGLLAVAGIRRKL